ncbi:MULTISPECIES: DUF2339 domain-containing protein [unclassified Moraxella]|uniref:DUF2339 domain-containing protein n=1 Tax=unclassified Moraxella TaxID=2685852 RepID=UPI003AF4BFF4
MENWIILGLIVAVIMAFVRIGQQREATLRLEKRLEALQQQLADVMADVYIKQSQATPPSATVLSEQPILTTSALIHHTPNPVDTDYEIDTLSSDTASTPIFTPTTSVHTPKAPALAVPLPKPISHEKTAQEKISHEPSNTPLTAPILNKASDNSTDSEGDENALNVVTSLFQSAKHWFFGENLVVRVGALVLLVGVVLLLKLASQYIHVSMPVRMAGVAFGGLVLTAIGYKTTAKKRNYGLTLQGAGFAVIYLTVFTSFKLYHLLPPSLTFALLAVLAGLTVMFSVWQNALPLAVLALGGAFFAPILVSRPDGSVVLLFSYYLLLNVAVAVIAHYRTWKLLNALSLAVTFGLAYLWGFGQYHAVNSQAVGGGWQSVRWQLLGLLVAHIALYLFISVRYSQQIVAYNLASQTVTNQSFIQQKSPLISLDSGLLFGTALLGFGLIASLLNDLPYHLAFASGGLSAIYLGLGYWLLKQHRASIAHNTIASADFNHSYQLLIEATLALGMGFLALVIPLALSGQWQTIGWAVQGVGLVWLGKRTQRGWSVWLGLLLQALSIVLLLDYADIMQNWYALLDGLSIPHHDSIAQFNKALPLTVLAVAMLLSAGLLRYGFDFDFDKTKSESDSTVALANDLSVLPQNSEISQNSQVAQNPKKILSNLPTPISYMTVVVGLVLYMMAIGSSENFWGSGGSQISVKFAVGLAGFLLVGQWLHQRIQWQALRQISRLVLPVAMLLWVWVWGEWFEVDISRSEVDYHITAVTGLGWSILGMVGCLAIAKLMGIWLISRWHGEGVRTNADQLVWLLTLLVILAVMIGSFPFSYWQHTDELQAIAQILPTVVSVLVLIGLVSASERWVNRLDKWLYWLNPVALLKNSAYLLVPMTALWSLYANYALDGRLLGFYFPVLNPLDLTLIGILLYQSYLAFKTSKNNQQFMVIIVASLAFVTLSSMLVRSFASFLGTPIWQDGAWDVSEIQTGLTILWTILAMGLMFLATKKAWRMVWFAGIGLLTLVVAKLLLVDMSNTSAIMRVVSFIGAGGLMLVIGYLAPLPPKNTIEVDQKLDDN